MDAFSWIVLPLAAGAVAGMQAGQNPERQIRQTLDRCVQSWAMSDSAGIASAYEPDGDFVSPDGGHASGRAAIEAFYRRAFANGYAHSHGTFAIRGIRLAAPNLAIVDGVWEITGARDAKGDARPEERGLAVAILRKHPRSWEIVALREQESARELHSM